MVIIAMCVCVCVYYFHVNERCIKAVEHFTELLNEQAGDANDDRVEV